MLKRTLSVLAAVSLLLPSTPAFAFQARNWPGVNTWGTASSSSSSSSSSYSFVPLTEETVLTRALFTEQLVQTLFPDANFEECLGALVYKDHPDYRLLFADVSISHPQAKEICVAMRLDLVRGYDDVTFRPEQHINMAEAAKMLTRAFGLLPHPVDNPKLAWYQPFVDAMIVRNVLAKKAPLSQTVTFKDLQDMLGKLQVAR